MLVRRVLAAILSTLLLTEAVAADVVVLKDGRQYSGIITNKDQLKLSPGSTTTVWLRTARADSARGFPKSQVDFVMLEDGTGHRESIDMTAGPDGEHATMLPLTPPLLQKEWHPGLLWIVGGAALFVVGATAKMGQGETESGLQPLAEEKSYNSLNGLVMMAGAGMVIAGVAISSRPRDPAGMQTGALPGPVGPAVAVSIRF